MSLPTRRTDPLEYVLQTVLGDTDEYHPYRQAMEAAGATTIDDLLDLTEAQLSRISWEDGEGGFASLPIAKINTILSIQSWYRTQEDNDDAVFLALTADTLKAHRRELAKHVPSPTASSSRVATASTASAKLSPADEFKKGIKRDMNAFKPFREKKYWNQWYRGFQATAKAQGLGNVLDPKYQPTTPDEQALFDVLQDYTFAVFTACLFEHQAANLVRSFSGPLAGDKAGNAQLLHEELVKLMSTGISARTQRTNIESRLLQLRLNKNWNKSIQSFLTHFAHQVNDLRELRDSTDQSSYSDVWCMSTLDSALTTHPEMSSHVSTLATSRSAIETGMGQKLPALSFATYLSQLQDHAIVLDNKTTQTSSPQNHQGRSYLRAANSSQANRNNHSFRKGRRNQQGNGNRDPTDPKVWLSDEQYHSLTAEQKQARRANQQSWKKQREQQQQSTNVPTTIAVNATTTATPATSATQSSNQTSNPSPTQPGTVLRNMMSTHSARTDSSVANETITVDGVTYTRQASVTLVYQAHKQPASNALKASLIDGGANGGLIGSDALILEEDLLNRADVVGVTDHVLPSLPIVQAAAKLDTTDQGPIIGVFSSYAKRNDGGPTVHSKGQMEAFGLIIDDKSSQVGGNQCIITTEGYVVPLHIRQGLPYLPMAVPSQEELESLPHVFFTADSLWDPSILDSEFPVTTFSTPEEATKRQEAVDSRVNPFGQLVNCSNTMPLSSDWLAFSQQVTTTYPDLDLLRPNFGWLPVDRIKKTLATTTQNYRAAAHYPFRKHFKSRFPAANVKRLPEWFSTDTLFHDTPAHDDGIPGHGSCTMLQLYGGVDSHFLAGYPLKSESDMPSTMEDFLRDHGAPFGLMSDGAKAELSSSVKNLLRLYCIKDRQSEPHYQHQNHVERRIQDVKRISNNIMDRTGTPDKFWLLCTLFVIGLLNHVTNLNGVTPLSLVTGGVTDISAYLSFHWWQEVLYETPTKQEALGRWVGVADKTGDALTYLILTNDTQQVVIRSNVRSATDPIHPNLNLRPAAPAPQAGNPSTRPIIHSVSDKMGVDPSILQLPKFSPEELLGRTFVRETEDGEKVSARVTRKIIDRDAQDHQQIKLLVSCGDDAYEEIISYNELSEYIAQQEESQAAGQASTWVFKDILSHEGPLKQSHPSYKGSSYNVLVEWGEGSETWEPLNMMAKDDPVTLALYAKKNNLLNTPGWKFLRATAKKAAIKQLHANATKTKTARRVKFGVEIPLNTQDAYFLDQKNVNKLWQQAMEKEINQLHDYNTFEDGGMNTTPPSDYTKITVHFVFDVKVDGTRKARLVAGGHMTNPPKDSVYSSVVSLRSIRIVCFLAELNNLKLMSADVGNAYLEAYTKEKICFTAGPEFGPLQGHLLFIRKALYGLRSSGARFHEKLSDSLQDLGFTPTYADPDVWIRDTGAVYEYITTWVDDLLVAMKNPQAFMDALQAPPHNYKLKGLSEPSYHLGGDFFRDPDGTLCYGAKTYIKKLVNDYALIFGEQPKTYLIPLPKNDHPELDDSPPCTQEETKRYQSLIGALQWTISLCRIDIAHAVMTLSRYRAAPLKGHLDRAKRLVGYLKKYPHACIRFRTGIPNHEATYGEHPPDYDWMHSIYGSPHEQLPPDAPEPKGKAVRTTTFVDANLMHDYTTGRSASGILHFLNQTPIECFSKRQAQIETATYGSEFVAARIGTEQIIDLRYTLRMLGVPLDGPSWMFGDNQSVITSSTIPHSTLSKRWNALSYHRVREAVASSILRFHFIDSKQNPADILTKNLDHTTSWPHIDTLLFRKGETQAHDATEQNSVRGVSSSPVVASPGVGSFTKTATKTAISRQPLVGFSSFKLET